MKKLLYILLFVPFALFGQENNLYHIPDTNFLSWLTNNHPTVITNDSLNVENSALYSLDEWGAFDVSNTNIKSLEGLQFFTSILELYISNNDSLFYIPSLSSIINLNTLSIHNNNSLTNLPQISGLNNLFLLDIQYNNSLSSLSNLIGLSALERLYITGSPLLLFIPELSELNNLTHLLIENIGIYSLPTLSYNTNLSWLEIFSNYNLLEIPPLSELSLLHYLSIYDNLSLINIPNLSSLTNLTTLAIWDNDLVCIDGYPLQFSSQYMPPLCNVDILDQLNQSFDAWNISIDLSAGWNMFGYGCPTSIDLAEGLSNHTDIIVITKDNNGAAFMPEFGFNGIGDFTPGFGYQIKITEAIEGFSLCDWYVNDIPEDNIVSLQEENDSLQAELDSIYGCIDEIACNYDEIASLDDGSCTYPEQGYDCDGNLVQYQVGDLAEGGIVFYIDETGQHGLVAAFEDIGQYEWGCDGEDLDGADGTSIGKGYQNKIDVVAGCSETTTAASEALAYESEGYSDWYLPSIDELVLLDSVEELIGSYWSSTERDPQTSFGVGFGDGDPYASKAGYHNVRPIRSF